MKETLRLESAALEQGDGDGGGDSRGRNYGNEAKTVFPCAGGLDGVPLDTLKMTGPCVEVEEHPFPILHEQPRRIGIEAALLAPSAERTQRQPDLLGGGREQQVAVLQAVAFSFASIVCFFCIFFLEIR